MNINNNFNSAKMYLEMVKEKFTRQDYKGGLAALAKAHSHTRAFLEQGYKLLALKDKVESPAGED